MPALRGDGLPFDSGAAFLRVRLLREPGLFTPGDAGVPVHPGLSWVLSGLVVIAGGVWLVGLAVATVVAPQRASDFLRRFASSARSHYTEQLLRLMAGVAFIVFAPEMRLGGLFRIFGWVLTLTAILLLLLPWRWHQRFAGWAIPLATGNLRIFGGGAFLLGCGILYAVF